MGLQNIVDILARDSKPALSRATGSLVDFTAGCA
jgi:hypothetical protein